MGTLSGKFKVGEPQQYGSIYGYQKFKFPVFKTEDPVSAAGYVKEELILNGKGETVGKTYYTRSFSRPNGAKRFYDSPEFAGRSVRRHDRPHGPEAAQVGARDQDGRDESREPEGRGGRQGCPQGQEAAEGQVADVAGEEGRLTQAK